MRRFVKKLAFGTGFIDQRIEDRWCLAWHKCSERRGSDTIIELLWFGIPSRNRQPSQSNAIRLGLWRQMSKSDNVSSARRAAAPARISK